MKAAPAYKSRTYECTIHAAHVENFSDDESDSLDFHQIRSIISEWADAYDDGLIEYAAVSIEESRDGRTHGQGFCTFSPVAYQQEESYRETKSGKDAFTPSNILRGSWRLVRSISGAQNYVVRAGIHAGKTGILHRPFEFGDFVDPGWNTTLRTRTLYEVATRMENGFNLEDLWAAFPKKMALIGNSTLEAMDKARRSPLSDYAHLLEPYYYIGREQLYKELEILGKSDTL